MWLKILLFFFDVIASAGGDGFSMPRDSVFSIGGGVDQPSLSMRVDGSRNQRIEPASKTGLNLLMDILGFQLKLTLPANLHFSGSTDRQGFWDEHLNYFAESFAFRWGFKQYQGFIAKSGAGFFDRSDITQQVFWYNTLIRVGGGMPLRYMVEKGTLQRGHYHTALVNIEYQSFQVSAKRGLLSDFSLKVEGIDSISATQNHSFLVGGGYSYGFAHPRVLTTTTLLLSTGSTRQDVTYSDRRLQRWATAGWVLEFISRCSVFLSAQQTLFFQAGLREAKMVLSRHDLQSVGTSFEIGYLYSF